MGCLWNLLKLAFCLIIIEAIVPGLLKAFFCFSIGMGICVFLLRLAENLQKKDKKREIASDG